MMFIDLFMDIGHISQLVVRSDWFHYCNIVCTIESIPVDCHQLLNKFVKLNFLLC